MPGSAIARHADIRPDFLAIGHVTRDLAPDGSWRLGGAVTYAALTAIRLGLRAAIVTSAPPDALAALDVVLPDIPLSVVPSDDATTFENIYSPVGREQFLRGRAAPLTRSAVPDAWGDASIVLLGPVAQEIDASIIPAFPRSLVGAAFQGWLRQWDDDGFVTPTPLANANLMRPMRALILSREDFIPVHVSEVERQRLVSQADATIRGIAQVVPLVVVTCGAQGAILWERGVESGLFPGYPAREVDPTGAGDVFAAAFLCALRETGDAAGAIDFANRVAACAVEAVGGEGIPTREMLTARWGT